MKNENKIDYFTVVLAIVFMFLFWTIVITSFVRGETVLFLFSFAYTALLSYGCIPILIREAEKINRLG